ncbi:MAG: radical SAM protein [Terriglobia bacterium]
MQLRVPTGPVIINSQGATLQEIFYYITLVCNLNCRHCYVGTNLAPNTHGDPDLVKRTLARCRLAGATKVTFLGGEPTLHPAYDHLIGEAWDLGFQKIIVDTSGVGRYPVPPNTQVHSRLTMRFSFEGVREATHDAIRGSGNFDRALSCLRRVVNQGITTEITYTINSANYVEVAQAIRFFMAEGISEMNFHFFSATGNGRLAPELALDAGMVMQAQELLNELAEKTKAPIRYPRLLVKKYDLDREIAKGCGCRIVEDKVFLIFPSGETLRCPLEITGTLTHDTSLRDRSSFQGCPLSSKLFLSGVPSAYAMTCISWKNHSADLSGLAIVRSVPHSGHEVTLCTMFSEKGDVEVPNAASGASAGGRNLAF